MASLAIITARGGSKRIPQKNRKEFCGKPIISYSIEAALNSRLFDEVMVSTDSREIADIAERCGAVVPFMRSSLTSNDYATTADVLKEVLEEYGNRGMSFEWMCCLYPTAPFITAGILQESMKAILSSHADSLIPVVRYGYPPQRAFRVQDEVLQYIYPEYERARSQDLEPEYHDAGQFYMCKVSSFERYKSLVMPYTIPFILDADSVQDIDTITDWHIAELKYIHQKYKERFEEKAVMKQIIEVFERGRV